MTRPDQPPAHDTSSVQVISRAAAILRHLGNAPRGRSLAEISALVGFPRSTVHRLVKALEHEGFVAPVSAVGGFRLGPRILQLANASREWLVADVRPDLVALSSELGETVDLAVMSGDRVTFIDQVARHHRLQAVSAVGVSFSLHSTANGKALLAELSDAEVRKLLPARLERFTTHTVTSRDALVDELAEVRRVGVAWDREENDVGICAVGTAVRSPFGVSTAITVPVPAGRFAGSERRLAEALLATRKKIEDRLTA